MQAHNLKEKPQLIIAEGLVNSFTKEDTAVRLLAVTGASVFAAGSYLSRPLLQQESARLSGTVGISSRNQST